MTPPPATDSLRIIRPGRHAAREASASGSRLASTLSRLPSQNPERAAGAAGESTGARLWGPSDFERGDQVRYLSVWYEVLRVGPIGLTVRFRRPRDGSDWDVPAEYAKVTGRRRDGLEDVDPA